jgi:hypothetical protein
LEINNKIIIHHTTNIGKTIEEVSNKNLSSQNEESNPLDLEI